MEYKQITYPFEGGITIVDIDSYRPPQIIRPVNSDVKVFRNSKDLTSKF